MCMQKYMQRAVRVLQVGLRAFAEAGGVIYAECGGLMILSQSIQPLDEQPSAMGKTHHPAPC